MYDFNTLKAGDKLMRKARMFGRSHFSFSKWSMVEWIEVVVESATPKMYVVEGEKHRRDARGKRGWGSDYYIPGTDGAPTSSNTEEFERGLELFNKLSMAHAFGVQSRLDQLATLEEAAEFATRFRQLEDELDAAIKRAQ